MIQACFQDEKLNLEESKLCLDFVNTMDWRGSEEPVEKLHTYSDLLDWTADISLIDAAKRKQLGKLADTNPKSALSALRKSKLLREALFRIFEAHARHQVPASKDLKTLNVHIAKAMGHLQLSFENEAFQLVVVEAQDLISPILWPITISAAQLLASDEMCRVGECLDEDGCAYLFFDTSRNGTQKYCGSKCATRAKVRRYRERQREEAT